LENIDALLALAEVSVAFAGFSSIVVLFKRRDLGEWHVLDASRFRAMLLASLFAGFFAALPFPLYKLWVPSELLWSVSSAAMAVCLAGGGVVHFRARRLFGSSGLLLWPVFQTMFWAAFLAQLLNIFSVGYHREAGPYILGVSWLLFQAGWQFYRLVAPPGPPAA
jgi:hypothetical protein